MANFVRPFEKLRCRMCRYWTKFKFLHLLFDNLSENSPTLSMYFLFDLTWRVKQCVAKSVKLSIELKLMCHFYILMPYERGISTAKTA